MFYLCKNFDPCIAQANKWVNIFVLLRSLYLHSFFRYFAAIECENNWHSVLISLREFDLAANQITTICHGIWKEKEI